MEFIRTYEDRYGSTHPVFYQGTFSQALNDAKRELRFLLVYLHDADATDTELFCRSTLSNRSLVEYVNAHFLFWGCSAHSDEGLFVIFFLIFMVCSHPEMTRLTRRSTHHERGQMRRPEALPRRARPERRPHDDRRPAGGPLRGGSVGATVASRRPGV